MFIQTLKLVIVITSRNSQLISSIWWTQTHITLVTLIVLSGSFFFRLRLFTLFTLQVLDEIGVDVASQVCSVTFYSDIHLPLVYVIMIQLIF